MGKWLTYFAENSAVPVTGLGPTISIYQLATTPTTITSGAAMTEVGAGWYEYYFSTWTHTARYTVVVDGSSTVAAAAERYKKKILARTEDDTFDIDG